jgi:hypothetical protein
MIKLTAQFMTFELFFICKNTAKFGAVVSFVMVSLFLNGFIKVESTMTTGNSYRQDNKSSPGVVVQTEHVEDPINDDHRHNAKYESDKIIFHR